MDLVAEWERASLNGLRLDQNFILEKFNTQSIVSISFDRDAKDYRDFELAIAAWDLDGAHLSLCRGLSHHYIGRLHTHIRFIERIILLDGSSRPRRSLFAMGDEGGAGVACFCSREKGAVLVPDPEYVASFGYASERVEYAHALPWHERKNQAYFRGTDSGVAACKDRLQAPRIATALRVRSSDMFDVKITGIEEGRADVDDSKREYEALGIFGDREPQNRILDYRYQIDIDGNSNAWSAFFRKLLTGSPVLKLKSHYRQWYYNRLVPWVHYVPVSNSSGDIEVKLDILSKNESLAARIGANALDVLELINYEEEMSAAAANILMSCTYDDV